MKITKRQLRRIIREAVDMQRQPYKAIRAAKSQIQLLENDLDELARSMAKESDMKELEIKWYMYGTALSELRALVNKVDKIYKKEISGPRLEKAAEYGKARKAIQRDKYKNISDEEIEMPDSDAYNIDDHFWG